MATRQSQEIMELKSVDPQDCSRHSSFMLPQSDFWFNNLIANIRQELHNLHKQDLDDIKFRLSEVIHQDVRTWKEALDMLITKGYVTQDNLIYLQSIIRVLGRADLLATTIEYANGAKQRVLHFYETTTEIRPGHRLMRTHIKGSKCQTGDHLDEIRKTISAMLWVPLEDVVVAGIQEGNSLYITFTLPAIYVATLEEFLKNKTRRQILKPLVQLGIDKIIVADVTFELDSGEETQITDERSDSTKIIDKMQLEIQQKTRQLKHLEEEILRLRRNQTEAPNFQNQPQQVLSARKRKPASDLRGSQSKKSKANVKKGKPVQVFENETEKKNDTPLYTSEDRPSSSLKKYDTPIREKNIVLKGKHLGDKKMQRLAHMNISVRKNTYTLYGSAKKTFPTLEEINTQSLYTKVNRLYPLIEDPRKKTKNNV